MRISGQQIVLMNPDDASKEGISDGETIQVGAQSLTLNVTVKVSVAVNRGVILLQNSFAGNPVNKLMDRNSLTAFVLVRKS